MKLIRMINTSTFIEIAKRHPGGSILYWTHDEQEHVGIEEALFRLSNESRGKYDQEDE